MSRDALEILLHPEENRVVHHIAQTVVQCSDERVTRVNHRVHLNLRRSEHERRDDIVVLRSHLIVFGDRGVELHVEVLLRSIHSVPGGHLGRRSSG